MQTHEWEALLKGTTPGPWEWHDSDDPDMRFIHDEEGGMCMTVEPVGSAYRDADPVLAAHAPAAVAEVIRLRQALEGRLRVWEKVADRLAAQGDHGAELMRIALDQITRILEGDNHE